MTDLYKAAEMALEYLNYLDELDIVGLDHKIQSKALEAALAQPEQEPIQAINDVIDYLYSTGADNDMANRAHIALKQLQMNLRDQTALHLLYKGDYEDLIAQPEQEPVTHAVIAGVLFDFMGWLTSRQERLVLSASDEASPAVKVIEEFAKMRGLSLDDAKVKDWQDALAKPEQEKESTPSNVDSLLHGGDGNYIKQAQPEQEPVDIHCPSCLHSFSIVPVAKREWVGLHLDDMPDEHVVDRSFLRGARWAESKLKEKNT